MTKCYAKYTWPNECNGSLIPSDNFHKNVLGFYGRFCTLTIVKMSPPDGTKLEINTIAYVRSFRKQQFWSELGMYTYAVKVTYLYIIISYPFNLHTQTRLHCKVCIIFGTFSAKFSGFLMCLISISFLFHYNLKYYIL